MGEVPDDKPLRASKVRFAVLGLLTSMAVLLYLDRVCMATAILYISEDLELTGEARDWVQSAFFWAYALAQVPAGWLGDRLGARRTLTLYVLAWSVFTAMTGLSAGLTSLLAARLLFGLAEAGAYPIAGKVNSLWMPFHRRALSSSVITLGGRAGGALGPMTAILIAWVGGWRPVFGLYALLGGSWALVFWYVFRDRPSEHSLCNEAERDLIAKGSPPVGEPVPTQAFPPLPVLFSLTLCLQNVMQFLLNVAWVILITKAPEYLTDVYKVSKEEAGFLTSLPLFASMAGGLLGGMLTDRLTRLLGLTWGRRLPGMVPRFGAAAAMLVAASAKDPYTATGALVVMGFCVDLGLPAIWAYFQDTGGRYVSTFMAWSNMFGNLGAAVSPLLLGWIARQPSLGWPAALTTSAGLLVVSALCWLGIDASKPILPPEAVR